MKPIIYNRPASMDEVLTDSELHNIFFDKFSISDNMKEAYKNGCKTDEEVLAYCQELIKPILAKAKESNEYQICDTLGGIFLCQCSHEDCSMDMVYEDCMPNGEFLYLRKHTY